MSAEATRGAVTVMVIVALLPRASTAVITSPAFSPAFSAAESFWTLATSTPEGRPSARIVLLKGADARGLVFFTDTRSRKGLELAANPEAALVFWWAELERQVRVCGSVEPIPADQSDAYFRSRPEGSRLSAWVSHQSQVVEHRGQLETQWADAASRYASGDIPRPPWWGGLRVRPSEFEFWQGRPNRLHDRIRYRSGEGGWKLERLNP